MRPDLSQERTTAVYLHFLPPLSFLSPSHNKEKEEKKAMRGKKGGERTYTYTEESREGKESTLLLGGKK